MHWELYKDYPGEDMFNVYINRGEVCFTLYDGKSTISAIVSPESISKIKQIVNSNKELLFKEQDLVYFPESTNLTETPLYLKNFVIDIKCCVCGNVIESNENGDITKTSKYVFIELDDNFVVKEDTIIVDYSKSYHYNCLDFESLLDLYKKHSNNILTDEI